MQIIILNVPVLLELQRWTLLCLLLINNYMNWLAIDRNHYRLLFFKIIMTVYFYCIIFKSLRMPFLCTIQVFYQAKG
jgi:hypothetical protein